MAVHWVTFRIEMKVVNGKTYEQRYGDVIDAIKKHATIYWDEPTSFYILETNSTRAQIAQSIRLAFAPSTDVAFIGSMDSLGGTVVGTASKLATLKKLVPTLVSA